MCCGPPSPSSGAGGGAGGCGAGWGGGAGAENGGPDDISASGYRAEIVPLRFRVSVDPVTGQLTALVDLTGFSSWARSSRPARITFDARRHLESVDPSPLLRSSGQVRLRAGRG